MDKAEFRTARLADVEYLYSRLREEDEREVSAAGFTSYGALMDAFESPGAETYTAVYRPTGEVMAMFGAAPVSQAGDEAVVWLLGTRRIDGCKFEYLHFGKRFLAYLLARYRRIYNYVDARSLKSIRFLKLLGFRFDPVRNIATKSTYFLYFDMEVA